ncbi:hypothetical protein JRQ81_003039 [Phrynocephalus forsythii]|uniref:acylglycerol lipase n=1 Tax=Phrynocephalus forsythii TaxID=171643 RepID=A0A9Q1AWJ8_9SAUR|nr:hypothetical protein JRQ81_003039 [Phrynocephalus forsythii]
MDLDVLNMFVIAGGTLAIPILAFVASFLLWPSALIRIYYWYWRRALGMQVRYVNYDDYQFCYSYRGRPGHRPSILMLHGFSAHKDMWLSVVKFLPKNLHLICVDLPGHEGTTRSSLDDYSIYGQVKRIHQVKTAKHGAALKSCNVLLLDIQLSEFGVQRDESRGHEIWNDRHASPFTAGLPHERESRFVKQLQELKMSGVSDRIPLIPSTPEEMAEMLKLCSYVRFKVPQQILQGLVDVRIPHNDFYRKLFLEIVGEKSRNALYDNMSKIQAATQVIWGKQDQVLDVSGADLLAKSIPNCEVHILENCGHSVVVERPRKMAKLLLEFLATVQNGENNKKLA